MKTELSPSRTEAGIVFSVYESRHIAPEQCVALHGMSYIVAGSLRVTEAGKSRVFGVGSLLFYRKNFLAKFTKIPAENTPFQSITVLFDHPVLRAFSQQYGVDCERPDAASPVVLSLAPSPILYSFYATLQPYFDRPLPLPLAQLKIQEALLLLRQLHPALQSILFDFRQPGKIDLEAFMQQNFRFNIDLKQWAYLTGRSLATFKRGFNTIFHTSPVRWLYQKRLEEAYYLLKEENKRPSDVYHDVGFESLAHFSYAFKKWFGHPPSSISADTLASRTRSGQ